MALSWRRASACVCARFVPVSMRGRILARAVAVLAAALVVSTGVVTATAGASSESPVSLESPEVAEELSHELQQPGPTVVTEGSHGGNGEATVPAGELVQSLSSEYSDTWSAQGAPLRTRAFEEPVNFKNAEGDWQAIDDHLVSSPLGGYETAADSFSLHLPDSLSSGVSISSGENTVSFTLDGASDSLPAISGSTATYREVLPSLDLAYDAESSGVREIATLEDSEAPMQLRYTLTLSPGLTPRQEPDGSIALVEQSGSVAFVVPAAVAFGPGAGAGDGRSLPTSLAADGDSWTATVDTGEEWLREALTHGPVLVDPSVTLSGSQNCTITLDTPKVGYCSAKEFQVGFDSTHMEHHGLLEFNVSSIPKGAVVLNANLNLYLEAHSTSNTKAVGVYRVTKPWTTGVTWEKYDGTNPWTTAGGDYNAGGEKSDASVIPSTGSEVGWDHWYPTKMVQEWVNGTGLSEGQGAANEGLIIKDETDNKTSNLLTFAGIAASSHQPFLEVAYEPRGEGNEPQYPTASTALWDRANLSVDLASGNLEIQANDLQMQGVAGIGFTSARTWNSLNGEQQEYGRWSDSNAQQLQIYGDGSVAFEDGSGAWHTFIKQTNGSFIEPPDTKAHMCATGSPSPCTSLPSGVHYELIYDVPSEERIEYNESGTGIVVEDKYKNKIGETFPSENHRVFTDTHGHKIEEVNNAEEFITEVKDVSGSRTMKYTYEAIAGAGTELKTYTDANGKTTTYGYTGLNLTSITDPVGNVTKLAYDGQQRITEIIRTTNGTHTIGPATKFKYYAAGSTPGAYCAAGQQATLVRDGDWEKPAGEKEGAEFTLAPHETLYCSNALDEAERTFDAESHESTATFDAFGNQPTSTDAAPGTGEEGNVFSEVYDKAGVNVECTATGNSKPVSTCPEKSASESALITLKHYNGGAVPYSATQQEDPESHNIFGCFNNESQSKHEPEPTCSAENSPTGTLASETDSLAEQNKLAFEYESDGAVKKSTDADGHATEYVYDEHGNLKEIKPPKPIEPTKITVDADGRPEVIKDGEGHTETLSYDPLDRVTEAVYAGVGFERTVKYSYDADGNITKRADPAGTTKYTVDKLNRLTKETLPSAATNAYEYDSASNLTEFVDSGGETKYEYNGLNELKKMIEPGPIATEFEYDRDHRLKVIDYASGLKEHYKLEPATGRPETITAEGAPTGLTVPQLTYSYIKAKDQTALIQSVTESSSGAETKYSYDPLDRLEAAVTEKAHPERYAFELDGAGNRHKQTVNLEAATGGTETFYDYNAANELLCRRKVSGECAESTTTDLSHYEYDKAGELTGIVPEHDTTGGLFIYNAASQLISIDPAGETAKALTYGGAGQDDLTSIGSTELQNSTLGLTKEEATGGTSYFARTPTGLLIDERTPSGDYNPLYDAQGDIIALVNSSKKVERNFRYGPYGENVKSEGTQTIPAPFRFKGGYIAPGGNQGETSIANGLLHFGQRFYEPTAGRWTQQDPVAQLASATQSDEYAAFGGDAINNEDPTGRCFPFSCEEYEGVSEDVESAGRDIDTVLDATFKTISAKDAAAACTSDDEAYCGLSIVSYAIADKLASESIFKDSYLERR
jgi:RHS repeat-associated protein